MVDRKRMDYRDGVIFDNLQDLKAFWDKVVFGNFRLIYRPKHFDDEQMKAEIDLISDWSLKCGNMALLLEELNIIYDNKKFSSKLNEVVFGGRELPGKARGVDLITVSQRPVGYGQAAISQADKLYCFGTHHAGDLKVFKDAMTEQAAEQIKSLKPLEYLEWDFRNWDWSIIQDEYQK